MIALATLFLASIVTSAITFAAGWFGGTALSAYLYSKKLLKLDRDLQAIKDDYYAFKATWTTDVARQV